MKGDIIMDWDQIEHNWLAMTHRIRPDRLTTRMPTAGAADAAQDQGDMAEIAVDSPEAETSVVSVAPLIA
ncbi:MAG: hypothetical protein EA339_14225 [Rhodobacteraceae bacterium]|nr:MAG: hypothetical protein EA339_14225 [Paracoccaceae bacterium]